MNKFKKDDKVIVLSGKDKGKVCKIIKVLPKKKMVLLDNANFITKHQKPTQDSKGGITQINKPLDWSVVQHINADNQPEKIEYSVDKKGKKSRVFKKTKKVLG